MKEAERPRRQNARKAHAHVGRRRRGEKNHRVFRIHQAKEENPRPSSRKTALVLRVVTAIGAVHLFLQGCRYHRISMKTCKNTSRIYREFW
jgi:hypothetical protein